MVLVNLEGVKPGLEVLADKGKVFKFVDVYGYTFVSQIPQFELSDFKTKFYVPKQIENENDLDYGFPNTIRAGVTLSFLDKELEEKTQNDLIHYFRFGVRFAFEIEQVFETSFQNVGPKSKAKVQKYNQDIELLEKNIEAFNVQELVDGVNNKIKQAAEKYNCENNEGLVKMLSKPKSFDFSKEEQIQNLEREIAELQKQLSAKNSELFHMQNVQMLKDVGNEDRFLSDDQKSEICKKINENFSKNPNDSVLIIPICD